MPFFKKLTIFGFKSFAEKTTFKFHEGFTAIVGPNGCGKSNIYDAIRWVLGEQNSYLLRCPSMTNVIFNGSADQKPLGVAEVSLTIGNSSKILPIEFNEVTITRRLYRSGESEYLLNKAPCRLKDITHLFLDTGLGHSPYSLIEQNKVDFIVNSKSQERRAIFEEAAGIAKYKVKKQEAISKLQLTSQNLLRIDDLLSEICRQKDALYRQAKKAQSYQQLREELQKLEITQNVDEYKILQGAYQSCLKEYERISDEFKQVDAHLTQLDSLLSDKKLTLKNKEEEIRNLQPIVFNLAQEMQKLNGHLLQQKERETNLNSQLARIQTEIDSSKEKICKLNEEILSQEKSKEESSKNLMETIQNLSQQETLLSQLEKEKEDKVSQLDDAKIGMIDFLNQLAHIRNQLTQAQIEEKNINQRIQRLIQEEEKIKGKKETIEKGLAELEKQIKEGESQTDSLKKRLDRLQTQKEQKTTTANKIESEMLRLREDIKSGSGRLHTLQELQKNLDGYFPGVRAILGSKESTPDALRVVADLIDFDLKFEQAIETALGENLQAIVLKTAAHAEQLIAFLKQKKAQRVTFIPLDGLKVIPPLQKAYDEEGVIGKALDLITYDKEFAPAFQYLLGNVLIVKDMPTAAKIIKNSPDYLRIVTLEGELLDSSGIIQGGLPRTAGLSLISRKKEILELSKKIMDLDSQLRDFEKKKIQLASELSSIQFELTNLQVNLHSQEIKVSNLKRDLYQTNALKEENSRQITSLMDEKGNLAQELIKVKTEAEKFQKEETEKNTVNAESQRLISILVEEVKAKEAIIKDKASEVTQTRVKFAQLTQLEESQNLTSNRLKQGLSDLEKEISRLIEEFDWLLKEKEREARKKIDFEREIEDIVKEKEEGENILNKFQQELKILQGSISDMEEGFKTGHQKEADYKNNLHQLELQSTEHKLKMENIAKYLEQEYSLTDLAGLTCLTGLTTQELLENIQKCRQRLESYKEINLMAPAEYEEIKKRFEFLNSQREDLINAKEDLTNLIQQIDTTSKELFDKTFAEVSTNFTAIVKNLFEGGTGALKLTNGASPQEPGVEISVQPPGKRLQSISLLSGGEKALVSICLLFAIFLHKPSPFCVLDEIDASLDEANVGRFNKLLNSFAGKTQFILITHNKLTITYASTLYGITMEVPGVSKLLSVQLEKMVNSE
ncbi:MAG: chromosome segregation protein SMC [bacterium]|nr:chromosome segregation protein SMC [bacterium]